MQGLSPTRRLACLGLGAAGAFLLGSASAAQGRPTRIVSLVSCLDAILVEVAERGQIAALSHYARDHHGSTIAKVARTLPYTHESAEEIIALRPDLVLATIYTPVTLQTALRRLGVRVAVFDLPVTIAAAKAQVREVAAACGNPQRGEVLLRRIEAALAAAAPRPGAPPVEAVIFQPNGFTTGPGNLMHAMMVHCGLENVAVRYGLKRSGHIPLERLIADPPTLLLAGETSPGAATWAERVVSHPALRSLEGRMQRATFPMRLFYCGGPVLIQTAQVLATARRLAEAQA